MPTPDPANRTKQPFTFYAADGRVYASNVDGKLIDLGSLARQDDGSYAYLLDGNQLTGVGAPSAVAALREMAERMSFLYLDGQFTALVDLRETGTPDLRLAERLDFTADELQPGERIEDARV